MLSNSRAIILTIAILSLVFLLGSFSHQDSKFLLLTGAKAYGLLQNNMNSTGFVSTSIINVSKGIPISLGANPNSNSIYVISSSGPNKASNNVIYKIDGTKNKVVDTIKVGTPQNTFLKDIAVDSLHNKIYLSGAFQIKKNNTVYEYDTLFIVNPTDKSTKKLLLYSEREEGKEGDASDISINSKTGRIYVGSLYPGGGNPGMYVISFGKNNKVITHLRVGESGVENIVIDQIKNNIYASAPYDNMINILNADLKKTTNITVHSPGFLSINSLKNKLYTSDPKGLITISMPSNKVISTMTGCFSHSVFNPSNNKLYVIRESCPRGASLSVYKVLEIDGTTGKIQKTFPIPKGYDIKDIALNTKSNSLYMLYWNKDAKASQLMVLVPH
jgi:hypothetical protein